jgi:hypothetical protein
MNELLVIFFEKHNEQKVADAEVQESRHYIFPKNIRSFIVGYTNCRLFLFKKKKKQIARRMPPEKCHSVIDYGPWSEIALFLQYKPRCQGKNRQHSARSEKNGLEEQTIACIRVPKISL